ncbi:MAG TPA: hypothetical protein VNC50_22205 [Planctomycetia bacterium]|jgi:hypothetical protein|nr:hypothetical protein [Planctomycetia bacterium]
MDAVLPVSEIVRAMAIFFERAYAGGEIPANRRTFAELPPGLTLAELLAMPGVQRMPGAENSGVRQSDGFAFRVGNRHYPHMKVLIRSTNESPGYVLAVDTHDEFGCIPLPEGEREAVAELRAANRKLGKEVETAWEAAGLPTQSSILRAYLARKASSVGAPA